MISIRLPARLRTALARLGDMRERQRQRAARRQEAALRTGRDEQRLERAHGHTYLVFPDRATADEVMQEIAATPIVADGLEWPVQLWDEDAGTAIGSFEAADGRVAVGHPWTGAERAWLADYVNGWRIVAILDALPADWAPKGDDEPRRP
jgi:hypothetical protein